MVQYNVYNYIYLIISGYNYTVQVSMENVFTPSEVKRVRSPSSTFSKHWCPHLGKVSKFWITIAEKHFLLRALARANVTYNTVSIVRYIYTCSTVLSYYISTDLRTQLGRATPL